ncbi:uncharacterized protein METZ01_LOCUS156408 [marine metagenome]|uniref:Uncharacterized protein n=1 Tax=marine metagenome TaxID=408172 RepID=A0A382AQ85_9ZZZZ
MENSENTGNWLKILIEKLNMPSTAEFCRKADLNRGLVDKLSKDMHSPRLDTLQKIKNAFPETNMNWLISRQGDVLENVQDDDETNLIKLYRSKLKSAGNPRMIEKFFVSVDYFVQDKREMEEMENNATAQDVKDQDLMLYRMELLFLQYRRHLVSDLLNQASKGGSLITGYIPGQKEKYSELLDHLNNEILKTVKLITDDVVNIPEETEQDVASETSLDEDMSVDERRQWSELLEYAEEMGESNIDDKE